MVSFGVSRSKSTQTIKICHLILLSLSVFFVGVYMEEYDYTFIYTPEKDNIISDMISRYPIHAAAPSDLQNICSPINKHHVEHVLLIDDDVDASCPIDFRIIVAHQLADKTFKIIRFTTLFN